MNPTGEADKPAVGCVGIANDLRVLPEIGRDIINNVAPKRLEEFASVDHYSDFAAWYAKQKGWDLEEGFRLEMLSYDSGKQLMAGMNTAHWEIAACGAIPALTASLDNQAEIIATGVTARLYFNNLDLNNARLNLQNPPEHLFIYVKGDLSIAGQNQINAVVYVAGNVRMAGNASLEGALATGGTLDISGNGDYYFDQNAVDKVDLGSNTCGGGSGGTQIDHFELSHSGQALTCNPEAVVIKACADASCSRLVAEQVSASLSLTPDTASNGWVGGNQLTFSGGSTTAQLRNNTGRSALMPSASNRPLLWATSSGVASVIGR